MHSAARRKWRLGREGSGNRRRTQARVRKSHGEMAAVQGGCRSEGTEAEKVVSSKKGREAEILQEETEAQQSE